MYDDNVDPKDIDSFEMVNNASPNLANLCSHGLNTKREAIDYGIGHRFYYGVPWCQKRHTVQVKIINYSSRSIFVELS